MPSARSIWTQNLDTVSFVVSKTALRTYIGENGRQILCSLGVPGLHVVALVGNDAPKPGFPVIVTMWPR